MDYGFDNDKIRGRPKLIKGK